MQRSIQSIVLINTESYASGAAIHRFIHQHPDRLSLVIVSHPHREAPFLQQFKRHFQRSGLRFVYFLFLNFSLYAAMTRIAAFLPRSNQRRLVPLRRLCAGFGIEYLEVRNINSPEVVDRVRAAAPDVIVVHYFDKILHEQIISIPTIGVLNVHTALLPRYRGLFPELWALSHGEREIGVTIHMILDRGIDSGPILAQEPLLIQPEHSVLGISHVANLVGASLTSTVLDELENDRPHASPQGDGSYYSFPLRGDLSRLRHHSRKVGTLREVVAAVFSPHA